MILADVTEFSYTDWQHVEIDYTNWRGERTKRVIKPLRFFFGVTDFHKTPGYLLHALDLKKNDYRTFALSEIHSWRLIDKVG